MKIPPIQNINSAQKNRQENHQLGTLLKTINPPSNDDRGNI